MCKRRAHTQCICCESHARRTGVSFSLQNRSPGAKPTPDLFLLVLASSYFPFNMNKNGFSFMQGGSCDQNQGLMPSNVFTAHKWEGTSKCFAFRGRKASWASFPSRDPVSLPCSCRGYQFVKQSSWSSDCSGIRLRSKSHCSPTPLGYGFGHASPCSGSVLRLWKTL